MVKKEKYFEGGTKILEKSYRKSLFISKFLAKGDVFAKDLDVNELFVGFF